MCMHLITEHQNIQNKINRPGELDSAAIIARDFNVPLSITV